MNWLGESDWKRSGRDGKVGSHGDISSLSVVTMETNAICCLFAQKPIDSLRRTERTLLLNAGFVRTFPSRKCKWKVQIGAHLYYHVHLTKTDKVPTAEKLQRQRYTYSDTQIHWQRYTGVHDHTARDRPLQPYSHTQIYTGRDIERYAATQAEIYKEKTRYKGAKWQQAGDNWLWDYENYY